MNITARTIGLVVLALFGAFAATTVVEHTWLAAPYACNSLDPRPAEGDPATFGFTTRATATHGTEIISYTYDFGDGRQSTISPASGDIKHTYAEPGMYHVTVEVNMRINGKARSVTGGDCKTIVIVGPSSAAISARHELS